MQEGFRQTLAEKVRQQQSGRNSLPLPVYGLALAGLALLIAYSLLAPRLWIGFDVRRVPDLSVRVSRSQLHLPDGRVADPPATVADGTERMFDGGRSWKRGQLIELTDVEPFSITDCVRLADVATVDPRPTRASQALTSLGVSERGGCRFRLND